MNIREGIKRIYIVLSLIIFSLSLTYNILHFPSDSGIINRSTNAMRNVGDPAMFRDMANTLSQEQKESIREHYYQTLKNISNLPISEMKQACTAREETKFFFEEAEKECLFMAESLERNKKQKIDYIKYSFVGFLVLALFLYLIYAIFSWIGNGFFAKKINQ